MEIVFPIVDLKPTKLSEIKAGMLFVESVGDLNNESKYMVKLNFPEKEEKVFCIIILNDSQPTVYKKDAGRSVYVVKSSTFSKVNKNTNMLNSVKQQIIFIFDDDTDKVIYLKTDKTKDTDIGVIKIGKHEDQVDKYPNLDFKGEKIIFKEGDRKIRTIDVQFKLDFDKDQWFSL